MNFLQLIPVLVALEHINLHKPETITAVVTALPEDVRNGLVTSAVAGAHINIPAFLGTLPPDIKAQVMVWAATQPKPTTLSPASSTGTGVA